MGTGTGTGTGMGTGTGTLTDVSNGNGNRNRQRQMDLLTETDSVRRMCRTGSGTVSDGRVEQGDGQRQMDVSNRETDSVGQTCRTETGGARRAFTKRKNQRKRRNRKQG